MTFHLGKPILVMIVIALVAGAFSTTLPEPKKADLTVWVFAEQHKQVYQTVLDRFREKTGLTVSVRLVAAQAMDLRLSSLFMSDPTSPDLPDLTELELGWVGKYFRPPVDQVGLIPLNSYFEKSGLIDKVVKQRLAPWTKESTIFGAPHDVHPVALMYREDLYREAGIDLESTKTWPELHQKFLDFENYWKGHGKPTRHAVEAGIADTSLVQMILLARHLNVIDQYQKLHINDPRIAQTIAFYAQMVAGPKRIGGQSTGGQGALAKDITDGNLCAFFAADWRVTYAKLYSPDVAGKMRLMPLPKFDSTDAPTTTWGGTMIGITKACKRPDDAWKLIEFLYFSDEGLAARRKVSDILPPMRSKWNDPIYHQPDPYFGGQRSQELFVELGKQVPERYQTPASTIAAASMTYVLNHAVDYVDEHQSSEGLEAACQGWLDQAAKDLERRIAHWRFE